MGLSLILVVALVSLTRARDVDADSNPGSFITLTNVATTTKFVFSLFLH